MSENDPSPSPPDLPPPFVRVARSHMREYLRILKKEERRVELCRERFEQEQFLMRNYGQLKRRKELCLLADRYEELRDNTREQIKIVEDEVKWGMDYETWRDVLTFRGVDLSWQDRSELSRATDELADSTDSPASSSTVEN